MTIYFQVWTYIYCVQLFVCVCLSYHPVACVRSTEVVHLKIKVMKLLLTHSLAAATPKMFSVLPFIFDLLRNHTLLRHHTWLCMF